MGKKKNEKPIKTNLKDSKDLIPEPVITKGKELKKDVEKPTNSRDDTSRAKSTNFGFTPKHHVKSEQRKNSSSQNDIKSKKSETKSQIPKRAIQVKNTSEKYLSAVNNVNSLNPEDEHTVEPVAQERQDAEGEEQPSTPTKKTDGTEDNERITPFMSQNIATFKIPVDVLVDSGSNGSECTMPSEFYSQAPGQCMFSENIDSKESEPTEMRTCSPILSQQPADEYENNIAIDMPSIQYLCTSKEEPTTNILTQSRYTSPILQEDPQEKTLEENKDIQMQECSEGTADISKISLSSGELDTRINSKKHAEVFTLSIQDPCTSKEETTTNVLSTQSIKMPSLVQEEPKNSLEDNESIQMQECSGVTADISKISPSSSELNTRINSLEDLEAELDVHIPKSVSSEEVMKEVLDHSLSSSVDVDNEISISKTELSHHSSVDSWENLRLKTPELPDISNTSCEGSIEDDLGWQGITVVQRAPGMVQVEWLHDGELLLQMVPERDYLGAEVAAFLPDFDNGLPSALERSGHILEGDVVVELNGQNVRDLEFADILRSLKPSDQGGMPRPLCLTFQRPQLQVEETKAVPTLKETKSDRRGFFSFMRGNTPNEPDRAAPSIEPSVVSEPPSSTEQLGGSSSFGDKLQQESEACESSEMAAMRFLFGDSRASEDSKSSLVPTLGLFSRAKAQLAPDQIPDRAIDEAKSLPAPAGLGLFSRSRNITANDNLTATAESNEPRASEGSQEKSIAPVPRKTLFSRAQTPSDTAEESPAEPKRSFFKFLISGSTGSEASATSQILEKMSKLQLEGGRYHSDIIVAKTGDCHVSEDETEESQGLQISWWRSQDGDNYEEVVGLTGPFYHPSLDDVDCFLRIRVELPVLGRTFAAQTQTRIAIDPLIRERAKALLEAGHASFPGLKDRQKSELYRLVLNEKCQLWNQVGTDQDQKDLRVECCFSEDTSISVDPVRVTTFTLQLGHEVTFQLLADTWEEREIIAMTFRSFKKLAMMGNALLSKLPKDTMLMESQTDVCPEEDQDSGGKVQNKLDMQHGMQPNALVRRRSESGTSFDDCSWACSFCTCLNACVRCEACSIARPLCRATWNLCMEGFGDGSWECPSCTFRNKAVCCHTCGSSHHWNQPEITDNKDLQHNATILDQPSQPLNKAAPHTTVEGILEECTSPEAEEMHESEESRDIFWYKKKLKEFEKQKESMQAQLKAAKAEKSQQETEVRKLKARLNLSAVESKRLEAQLRQEITKLQEELISRKKILENSDAHNDDEAVAGEGQSNERANVSEDKDSKWQFEFTIKKAGKDDPIAVKNERDQLKKDLEACRKTVIEKDRLIEQEIKNQADLQDEIERLKVEMSEILDQKSALQKTLKANENDVRFLNTSIEVRDQKIEFLENALIKEQAQADRAREQEKHIILLEGQLLEDKQKYESERELQTQMTIKVQKMEEEKNAAELAAEDCLAKMISLQQELLECAEKETMLVTQRNSYKSKSESLARDLQRLCGGRTAQEIERMVSQFEKLQVQVAVLKADRDQARDEAREFKEALDGASKVDLLLSKDKGAAKQAVAQSLEMQRLLSTLTETIGEKDLQLHALRESNRMLAQQLMNNEKEAK